MKRIYIFLFLLICTQAGAQSLSPKVIASAGGYFTSANASLSWTLGETIGQTFTNGSYMLTQGFQQPYVTVSLLNLKAYLEGFYSGSGFMNNSGSGGCLFAAGASPNPLDVDTLFISAMHPVTHVVVDTKSGILKTNGTCSVTFSNAVVPGSSYYIRVKHRNTIETWSANPVLMSTATSYDFTTAANKAFGNNMVQTPDLTGFAFYSGDISDAVLGMGTQDGVIESQDYTDMENSVQSILVGYVVPDVTGDAVVESADYIIMENNVAALRFSTHP